MGNNESLPPPPPSGQPPQVPPNPAQTPPPYNPPPQYTPPPEYPPTQQMPPTQQYTPPTQAYPQQPDYTQPGGYPPQQGGYPPQQGYPQQGYAGGPPAAPPKKNTGLIIGGGIAAVVALIGGVVLFTGGDDDKTPTLGDDTTIVSATTLVDGTTIAPVTTSPSDTLVITAPPSTQAPATTAEPGTTAPNEGGDVVTVVDDTGTFSVFLPASFQTDTTPVTSDSGITFARVAGSDDLDSYRADFETFGIFILAGSLSETGPVADMVAAEDPGRAECTDITTSIGFPTSQGPANVMQLDGCGPGGAYARVIIGIEFPELDAVVLVVSQGIGPSDETLLPFTQAVFETVTPE